MRSFVHRDEVTSIPLSISMALNSFPNSKSCSGITFYMINCNRNNGNSTSDNQHVKLEMYLDFALEGTCKRKANPARKLPKHAPAAVTCQKFHIASSIGYIKNLEYDVC